MTFEEVEKAIQFSLDRQSQTEAILQQVAESHAQAEQRISQLEQAVVTGINLVNTLNTTMIQLVEARRKADEELAEHRKKMAEDRKKTEAEMAKFSASHEEYKERLDAFILVLERYISEQRNGKGRTDQSTNGQ